MDEKQRKKVLLLLFGGVLMSALDIAIVGPALPAIQAEFAVGSRELAWVFNIYVLGSLLSTPIMAKLSDRFGRRSIYILDVALFMLGSLIIAASHAYPMLIVGRIVQAVGAGGILPVAAAVIGDTFPAEKRGGALGLIGAVFGIAFLIGPVLAGVILKYADWHWLFLVNLPVGALLIVGALRILPSTRPARARPFDFAGVAVLALLLGALSRGVTALDPGRALLGLLEPRTGVFLLFALVLVPVFWSIETRAEDPVLQPRLFRSRQMIIAGILAITTGMAETSSVFLPSLAVTGLGMSTHQASFWMIPTVIALAIGSPVGGRLLDRIGSKMMVLFGLLSTAAGFSMFGFAGTQMTWFVAGQLCSGLGLSALLGPLRYVVLNEALPEERGAAQGLLAVVLAIGRLTGAALVGAIASAAGTERPEGFQHGFIVIGVTMLLMTLAAVALKSRAAELAAAGAVQQRSTHA